MSTTHSEISLDETERGLLRELLQFYESGAALPVVVSFRAQHATDRGRLDALEAAQFIRSFTQRYYLTIAGLLACDSAEARTAHERCADLAGELRESYLKFPTHSWEVGAYGDHVGRSRQEVSRLVTLLWGLPGLSIAAVDHASGFVTQFALVEPILDAMLPPWREEVAAPPDTGEQFGTETRIERVEIRGYRPFADLSALLGRLTVIIGANASGKSSFFDALRLLTFAAERPLPPEIDPRNTSISALFHAGGPERIELVLTTAPEPTEPLRYEVTIHGPVGAPRVVRERLVAAGPLPQDAAPFAYLDVARGRGTLRARRDEKFPTPWSTSPGEIALRSAQNPSLGMVSQFRNLLASFRFYGGFEVSPGAAIRRPAHIEERPILAEEGSNLSAVLNSLVLEHHDAWEELETCLRSVIPTFESLGVRPRGGKGMAIGVIRERGVKEELTLADLSDGTLRLLCWLALAVSPTLPPLVCLDEPEMGLHPRVLPTLAGALKLASARSQILVATHSPHFLTQFMLEDIAVMRRDARGAVFLRPATSGALRAEVAEIGGDALARLFLSEELEALA